MIDLTPLDVRNKRGDFKRLMRGYDPQEVDVFLEMVAERLEGLVRENLQLKERAQTLNQQVTSQLGREQAVQDALVTAQELRADIKAQSQREAEHVLKEAETEARRLIAEADAQVRGRFRGVERRLDGANDVIADLERRRSRFLKEFRQLLERELDVVEVEESRTPLEERAIDLDLGPATGAAVTGVAAFPEPSVEHDLGADEGVSAESGPAEEAAPAAEAGLATDAGDPAPPLGDPAPAGAIAIDPDHDTVPAELPPATGEPPMPMHAPAVAAPGSDGVPAETWPVAAEQTLVQERQGFSTDEAQRARLEPITEPERAVRSVPEAEVQERLALTPDFAREAPRESPTELETPSFTAKQGRPAPSPAPGQPPADGLSASMEAEALAQARSQVVEVTGADGDALADVPRLEEVLAEAGADSIDPRPGPVSPAPQSEEEIAPPRIPSRPDDATLLYFDPEEPGA